MVCEMREVLKNRHHKNSNGNQFFVNISNDCDKLKPGDTVLESKRT